MRTDLVPSKNNGLGRTLVRFAAILMMCSTSAIYGDISFGVTGSTGFGDANANSIYRFNTTTGANTLIGSTSVEGNSFAFNSTDGYYYYGDHSGSNLYSYNVNTGVNTLMGNLDNFGKPAGTTLSGGADFFDGRYYYSPEVTNSNLYFAEMSPGGTSISSGGSISINLPTGITSLGDFGDIAINPLTGIMFGSSSNLGGAPDDNARFWTIDLNDPTLTLNVLGVTPAVYQLAFDDEGMLIANEWQSNALYFIDPNDGSIISRTSTGFNGDYYDLASFGLAATVPEPSAMMLFMVAAIGLGCRRKR